MRKSAAHCEVYIFCASVVHQGGLHQIVECAQICSVRERVGCRARGCRRMSNLETLRTDRSRTVRYCRVEAMNPRRDVNELGRPNIVEALRISQISESVDSAGEATLQEGWR